MYYVGINIKEENFFLEIAQARPVLHTSLMQRMTDVLSRMLNDPATRAALSGGGEDSLEGVMEQHVENNQNNSVNNGGSNAERNSESGNAEREQADRPQGEFIEKPFFLSENSFSTHNKLCF